MENEEYILYVIITILSRQWVLFEKCVYTKIKKEGKMG